RLSGRRLSSAHIQSLLFIFFLQAEDGIRDRNVTGVQTCALPICLFKTGAQEVDANYLIGNLELLQRVGDFQDAEVGGYELRVADLESIYGVSEELQEQLPDGLYARSILQEMPELFSWLEMLDVNDDVIFVLMSIVAVINIISALLISILERTSMIGVLKALGMNNWQIRKVFF